MAIFDKYAKYYDLLYKDKNYQKEVDYVDNLIRKYSTNKIESLLDIGCGTGTHAKYFAEKGYSLTGIDISEDMIKIAEGKQIPKAKFHVGDAIDFKLKEKFDTVLSLFQVVDYYLTNDQLEKAFTKVVKHLKPGGLFIFDIWFGPCVLNDLPKLKSKEFEDDEVQIIRVSTPKYYPSENRVDVTFDITILDKKSRAVKTIKETHRVRYFFSLELEKLLKKLNFAVLSSEEWLTGKKPGNGTFDVCWVTRLIK